MKRKMPWALGALLGAVLITTLAGAYLVKKTMSFDNAGMWVSRGDNAYVSFNAWATKVWGTSVFGYEYLNWYAQSYTCPPAGGVCTELWSDQGSDELSAITRSGKDGFAVSVAGVRGMYIFSYTPTSKNARDRRLDHREEVWGFVRHLEMHGWHTEGLATLAAPGEGVLAGNGWQSVGKENYTEHD